MLIYIQVGIEYATWNQKRLGWHADKKFMEEYGKNDESESALRQRLSEVFLINTEISEQAPDVSTSVKYKESVKVTAGMYTSAFFAQMKSVKAK